MSSRSWVLAVALLAAACSSSTESSSPPSGSGGAGGSSASACVSCSADSDCASGSKCTILTGQAWCLRTCPKGNECDASEACLLESSLTGEALHVCVPQVQCGEPPLGDAGTQKDAAPPKQDAGGGGTGGSGGSGGGAGDAGAGAPLLFAAVGDTRGSLPLKSSYPTAVITQIYADIQNLKPRPQFVVSTGDYAFKIATDTSAQLDLYLGARKIFTGPFYPAVGNHECTWLTTSNCGPGTADGMTPQYKAFLSKILEPTGQTLPYYAIEHDAPDGSWTSKLVFIAANVWTDAQGTWLDKTMSVKTTYTFVVRHEPSASNTAPGVTPSDAILAKHPYTLMIVGHIHTYDHTGREVMFGNGGAPKSGTKGWGFGLFRRRADGAIQVEAIDYQSLAPDPSFTFALYPNGAAAP